CRDDRTFRCTRRSRALRRDQRLLSGRPCARTEADAMSAPAIGPARGLPPRREHEGRTVLLAPLDVRLHAADLWAAVAGHDRLWDYMSDGPFSDVEAFGLWLEGRAELSDPFYFAVTDLGTGRAVGLVTLMEIRPAHGVIEVGNIVFSPVLQRTCAATEA